MPDDTITVDSITINDTVLTPSFVGAYKTIALGNFLKKVTTEAPEAIIEYQSFVDYFKQNEGRGATTNEQALFLFPRIWDVAGEEIFDLIAILVTPAEEFEHAYEQGNINAASDVYKKLILFHTDTEQQVELVTIIVAAISAQISNGKLGEPGKKLQDLAQAAKATGSNEEQPA